jgi:hypothetical protein
MQQHTFARGARQFVVQLALETMLISEVYLSSLTPTTNIGASLLGAEIITFLAPPYYSKELCSYQKQAIGTSRKH